MLSGSERVEAILCEAVEIEYEADRNRFLDGECGGDDELRAAVDALIRNHFDAGSFLYCPAPLIALAKPPESSERPGSVVGPYKLLQQIGEGGFGVVYMSEQTKPVRRKVAMKVIKPGMDSKEVVARFEAERQALALMNHPNIASVLDAGTTESGRPYFVMELVRGVPLTEYCDSNHLPAPQRLQLFVSVCRAIQHAHQKGVIHRDLKPSNIMVTLHDGKPVPKIIDFGVSKALSRPLTEKTLFTAYGQMVGTPAYMSPEQTEISGLDIDTRSDVYSLGVLLYELLTGSTPFDARRLRHAGYAEMQRIIREEDPPRPSTRLTAMGEESTLVCGNRGTDSRRLGQMVRGDLDWIVMKALEKDRNRRYETADSFARDVNRFLDDEPVEAHPPSAAYRFLKFARRKKRTLLTAATIASALVVGTVVSTRHAIQASRSEHRAETEAAAARAVEDFINRDLLAPSSPYNDPDRNLTVREALDRASARIEGRFEDQPLVEAAIRHTIGTSYFALGEYNKAEQHLREATEIRRRHLGEEHEKTLASLTNLSAAVFEQGRFAEAEQQHAKLLEIQTRLLGAEHPGTLASLTNFCATLYAQGRYTEAEEHTRRLLEIQRRVLAEDDPSLLSTEMNLAAVRKAQGHYDEAERRCREVLHVQRRVLRHEHPDTLNTTSLLANCLLSQGRLDEAEELHREVLDVRTRVLGREHPSTLSSMNNLSVTIHEQGRYPESQELRSEVLSIQRRVLGSDHPETVRSMMNLANVMNARGDFAGAESLLEEALDANSRVLGGDHPETLNCVLNLINTVLSQGRNVEAEERYRDLLERQWGVLGLEHPNSLRTMTNLAVAIHKQGRHAEAESLRRTVFETQRSILGPEHPDTLVTMLNLGNAIAAQDRHGEAETWYREALEKLQVVLGAEHPSTLKCMLALAQAVESQGRAVESEDLQRGVLELQRQILGADHPDTLYTTNALAWFLCFSAPAAQQSPEEAVALAQEAVLHQPGNSRCLQTLGQAQYRAGDLEAAIDTLRQSLEVNGANPHDLLTLALALWRSGDRNEACTCYEMTLDQELRGSCPRRLNAEFLSLTAFENTTSNGIESVK